MIRLNSHWLNNDGNEFLVERISLGRDGNKIISVRMVEWVEETSEPCVPDCILGPVEKYEQERFLKEFKPLGME